jgi:uncharacterized protein YlxP (DUF503 family)
MSLKRKSRDFPVCFFGKVIFEFFNNQEEDFKQKSLKNLAKEVRKIFNVSCLPVEEHEIENPESGELILAICAANHESGKELLDKVLAHFDAHAPARILSEEIQKAEI